MDIRHRLAAAWQAFKYADMWPHYAVVYDVPELEEGEPTGDISEQYYEAFHSPDEAKEMFCTAYPRNMDNPPQSPRIVMVLHRIGGYPEPY
ncbi:MAG: hypothetical protein DI537_14460 [Stutzerimonas stutzeri]|nr:MAG: hypothetical protein DI537_14460 [Stutzerimonas stutzeri]